MILSYSISARPTPTVRFFKSLGQRWAEYEEWGAGSEDYAFEAYERMTDGGINGANAVKYWYWLNTWRQQETSNRWRKYIQRVGR